MATIVRPRGAGRARRLAGCLLATGRVTAPELLAVLGLLAALAAATLGSRIAHGGFSNDDWSYLTLAQYPGPSGVVDAFHYLWFRPLMLLYWPATFGLLAAMPARTWCCWRPPASRSRCCSTRSSGRWAPSACSPAPSPR